MLRYRLFVLPGCFSRNCNLDVLKGCLGNSEKFIRELEYNPFHPYVLLDILWAYGARK